MRTAERLVLGTAQLGMPYGKIVPTKPPADDELFSLLDSAWDAGVRTLDTAPAYGTAEERIGKWATARSRRPHIISKLPAVPEGSDPEAYVHAQVAGSCSRLSVPAIDFYLAHRERDLHLPGVQRALAAEQREGRIGGYGASVYERAEWDALLNLDGIHDIEVPASLVDRRFLTAAKAARVQERGIRIWARSAFLQGTLFLPALALPPFLAGLRTTLADIEQLARENDTSLATLSLHSVLSDDAVTGVLIGVSDSRQLADCLQRASAPPQNNVLSEAVTIGARADPMLVDPRRWPRRGKG